MIFDAVEKMLNENNRLKGENYFLKQENQRLREQLEWWWENHEDCLDLSDELVADLKEAREEFENQRKAVKRENE